MDRLKVVLVTPKAPDPFASSPTGWYYLVARGLAERGHRVTCLSACGPSDDGRRAHEALEGVDLKLELFPYPSYRWLKRKWGTLRQPYSYFISDDMRERVAKVLRAGYDILHLDDIWTGYLGLGEQRSVLFLHHLLTLDFQASGFRSWHLWARKFLGPAAERALIRRHRYIRVESPKMAQEVRRVSPKASLFEIPCAIPTNLYRFRSPDPHNKVIGLIAGTRWHLGRWAAERLLGRIWPRVKARVPEAELLVVGWGARSTLASFLDQRDVTILEDVPDIEPYFRRLCALAYPLTQGSGVKVKVLEAMAYGVPVVTTSDGAEGVKVEDGVHAFIADDDDTFVEKTVALLHAPELRARMSEAARQLVVEEYSLRPTVERLEAAYGAILNTSMG